MNSTLPRITSLVSFFIIAFSGYVESQTDFRQTFFEWLQVWPSSSWRFGVITNKRLEEPNRNLEVSG